MQNIQKYILTIATLMSLCFQGFGQLSQSTHKVSHEFSSVDHAVVVLLNISGHMTIHESSGNQLSGEVEETIEAQSQKALDQAKKDLSLQKEVRGDTLIYYLKTPCQKDLKFSKKHVWGYDWKDGCDWDNKLEYAFDFDITVPKGVELYVSTINRGDIIVNSASGVISANNVNGKIQINSISSPAIYASTINGDVDLEFDKNPVDSSRFYTLNGDINAHFQKDIAALVSFKTFHGDFYTDVDQIRTEPTVKKVGVNHEKGISYRINDGRTLRVGSRNSDLVLNFETFNGNAYLRTNKKK